MIDLLACRRSPPKGHNIVLHPPHLLYKAFGMFGGGGTAVCSHSDFSGSAMSSGGGGGDDGDDNDERRWKGKLDTRWYDGAEEETDEEVKGLYHTCKRFSGANFSLD